MIVLPPYEPEWMIYSKVPAEHRWIFNKLELCQRLSQQAWPVGLKFPPGDYCVRPIINLQGMATGGFRKVSLSKPTWIQEPHGFCVTPWTDGPRWWHLYINDECYSSQRTNYIDEYNVEHMEELDKGVFTLPEPLRGISRYMLVETLSDTVIDVSPRHMTEEVKQHVVDDYKTFDPGYQLPAYTKWGFQSKMQRVYDEATDMWHLEEIEND